MIAVKYRPYIPLLIAQLAIASATICGRYALTGASPIVASAFRMAFAALPLCIIALVRRERRMPWAIEGWLSLAGALLAGHFIVWLSSLNYASVAVSTLLVCSSPLWNALFDIVVLRRMPPKAFIVGLAASLAGLGLVVNGHHGTVNPPIPGHPGWGAALALGGAIFMSVYLVAVEYVGKLTQQHGIVCNTRSVVTRTFSWAAVYLLAGVALQHETLPLSSDTSTWLGIVGMAVGSQLVGHTLMNGAVRVFAARIVALASLLVPVFAAGFAAVVFDEHLTLRMIAGSALIMAGLVAALQRPVVETPDGVVVGDPAI